MPGMNKEDVKVWVEEKMLVVKAEKAQKKKQENEIVELQQEKQQEEEEWSAKSYGRYSSRIALPDNVQFENIKAEVKDGMLYITIPKATSYSNILDIQVQWFILFWGLFLVFLFWIFHMSLPLETILLEVWSDIKYKHLF